MIKKIKKGLRKYGLNTKKADIIEKIISNQIEVKGYQRKSTSGKVIQVHQHQRVGEMKQKSATMKKGKPKQLTPEQIDRQKLREVGKRDLLSGKQAQLSSNGSGVVVPSVGDLVSIFEKDEAGKDYNTPLEARILLRRYKETLIIIKSMVDKLGGIEEARKNETYKKLIAKQSERIKKYFNLVKNYQTEKGVGQFGKGIQTE